MGMGFLLRKFFDIYCMRNATEQIVGDEVDTLFNKYPRMGIDNILVLTGGGTAQAFFALGSCGCLHDNGMLEHDSHDVISVVSGGSLVATVLEMCYLFKYDLEDDWFNKYVREGGVYAWMNSNSVGYFAAYGGDLDKFSKYIFEKIPAYNRGFDADIVQRGPVFEYNYIDVGRQEMSSDHSDIVDFDKGFFSPNWYFNRMMRCSMLLQTINGKGTVDAGMISNIPSTTIYKKYDVKNQMIIVKVDSNVKFREYRDYRPPTTFGAVVGRIDDVLVTAAKSISEPIDILANSKVNMVVSTSNSLNPSKDQFHKKLFRENTHYTTNGIARRFIGLIDIDRDYPKVMENEGYLQMYYSLKERGMIRESFKFRIPNPDVYDHNVAGRIENVNDVSTINIIGQVVRSVFDACVDVHTNFV
jgi:hypothetical protein